MTTSTKTVQFKGHIQFPAFTGIRCLMMPYIQGEPESVPECYRTGYESILQERFLRKGDIGYLTIDESVAVAGKPHRGARSKTSRALHTEAGRHPDKVYAWGGGGWGSAHRVTLDDDVRILLANNVDGSCAIWDAWHENTSIDGDIGDSSQEYPYSDATFMRSGDVFEIGILTPHESLPVTQDVRRQFIRIVSSGVHGREEYFTRNPLVVEAST
jgi:hypothetical protein